jgi:type IV pilus assembly protein PilA
MRGSGPWTGKQQEDIMLSSLMQRLNERRAAEFELEGSADAGFTLIELMVVLLILAILLAIAIPTFLGVTGSANDRAAQSNLNTALTNAKSIYEQNNQIYPTTAGTVAATIQSNEPSLPMNTVATTALTAGQVGAVSSLVDGNGAVVYALAKNTSECWWVSDSPAAVSTSSNPPWTTTATVAIPSGGIGVPAGQGVYYGVYKLGKTVGSAANSGVCDQTGLAASVSNIATPGFPAAQ